MFSNICSVVLCSFIVYVQFFYVGSFYCQSFHVQSFYFLSYSVFSLSSLGFLRSLVFFRSVRKSLVAVSFLRKQICGMHFSSCKTLEIAKFNTFLKTDEKDFKKLGAFIFGLEVYLYACSRTFPNVKT